MTPPLALVSTPTAGHSRDLQQPQQLQQQLLQRGGWIDLALWPDLLPPDGTEVLVSMRGQPGLVRTEFRRHIVSTQPQPTKAEIGYWLIAPGLTRPLRDATGWQALPNGPFCACCGETHAIQPLRGASQGFFRCGNCNHEFGRVADRALLS